MGESVGFVVAFLAACAAMWWWWRVAVFMRGVEDLLASIRENDERTAKLIESMSKRLERMEPDVLRASDAVGRIARGE